MSNINLHASEIFLNKTQTNQYVLYESEFFMPYFNVEKQLNLTYYMS